jgi:hypothetical protein
MIAETPAKSSVFIGIFAIAENHPQCRLNTCTEDDSLPIKEEVFFRRIDKMGRKISILIVSARHKATTNLVTLLLLLLSNPGSEVSTHIPYCSIEQVAIGRRVLMVNYFQES